MVIAIAIGGVVFALSGDFVVGVVVFAVARQAMKFRRYKDDHQAVITSKSDRAPGIGKPFGRLWTSHNSSIYWALCTSDSGFRPYPNQTSRRRIRNDKGDIMARRAVATPTGATQVEDRPLAEITS